MSTAGRTALRVCQIPALAMLILIPSQEAFPMSRQKVPKFTSTTNIGEVGLAGSLETDTGTGQIRMTGSGENIWGRTDGFTFAWTQVIGDVSCRATVAWVGTGRHPHRKAGWMIRAGLEADDPYVDAVVHGDGLISMQYRIVKGGETAEVKSPITGPAALTFERTGEQFTLYVHGAQGSLHPVGTITVPLGESVYAGLAVCSHDSTVMETAVFSEVDLLEHGRVSDTARVVESSLEIFDVATGMRTVVRRAREHFEAPNWSRDGETLIYNSGGLLYAIPVGGGDPGRINTGSATRCNNDHGLSWDGKSMVVSHHGDDGRSRIYLLPIQGGEPALVTEHGPSYWHGWSPDDRILAYCAERKGEYDVYTIPIEGGSETRLTTAPGLDDGPEFSPDGLTIYFNSVRTGQMKIWKMAPDGSGQTQVTPDDEFGDWFPHPSPDGTMIVFLSYDRSVDGHPPNKDVVLRLMPAGGGQVTTLTRLFGGQGTINVHSWSPDSKQFAFVSYRLIGP